MPPKRARTSPAKKRVQPRARHRSWPKYWRLVAFSALVIAILLLWAAIDRHLAPRANTDQPRFDAILVLGTNADRDGNPTPAMLDRVTEAVREYQRGVAPRLIFSGGAAHNRFVEANVMARVAIAQGIPPSAIFTEPRALDTIQNFCFSFAILRAHQWHSVEVITSAAHMPRAAIILANLPGQNIAWRMRQAPGLYSSGIYQRAAPAVEILKTAHYLVWSRWQESCVP